MTPHLNRLLEDAENRWNAMTPAERKELERQQKISFVYGQLMDCAPEVTKEDVERWIKEDEVRWKPKTFSRTDALSLALLHSTDCAKHFPPDYERNQCTCAGSNE